MLNRPLEVAFDLSALANSVAGMPIASALRQLIEAGADPHGPAKITVTLTQGDLKGQGFSVLNLERYHRPEPVRTKASASSVDAPSSNPLTDIAAIAGEVIAYSQVTSVAAIDAVSAAAGSTIEAAGNVGSELVGGACELVGAILDAGS